MMWLVIVATAAVATVHAQDRWASVQRADCMFTTVVTGDWRGEAPRARVAAASDRLTVAISEIDLDEGTAAVMVAGRRAIASARADRSTLHVLDLGPDRTTLTTILSQEGEGGKLKAVHTQAGRFARQYYGTCAVKSGEVR